MRQTHDRRSGLPPACPIRASANHVRVIRHWNGRCPGTKADHLRATRWYGQARHGPILGGRALSKPATSGVRPGRNRRHARAGLCGCLAARSLVRAVRKRAIRKRSLLTPANSSLINKVNFFPNVMLLSIFVYRAPAIRQIHVIIEDGVSAR